MQVAFDFADKAIDAILHAIALAALLAGAVIWQTKRAGKGNDQYRKDIDRLTSEIARLGERIGYLEGLANGRQRRERT